MLEMPAVTRAEKHAETRLSVHLFLVPTLEKALAYAGKVKRASCEMSVNTW